MTLALADLALPQQFTTQSVTSAPITPTPGALVLVYVTETGSAAATGSGTIDSTIPGMGAGSWSKVQVNPSTAAKEGGALYWMLAPAGGGSGTITLSLSAAPNEGRWGIAQTTGDTVDQTTPVVGAGRNDGLDTTGTVSLTLDATPTAGDLVVMLAGSRNGWHTQPFSPGQGFTKFHDSYGTANPESSLFIETATGKTDTAAAVSGMYTASNMGAAIIIKKAASSGGGTTTTTGGAGITAALAGAAATVGKVVGAAAVSVALAGAAGTTGQANGGPTAGVSLGGSATTITSTTGSLGVTTSGSGAATTQGATSGALGAQIAPAGTGTTAGTSEGGLGASLESAGAAATAGGTTGGASVGVAPGGDASTAVAGATTGGLDVGVDAAGPASTSSATQGALGASLAPAGTGRTTGRDAGALTIGIQFGGTADTHTPETPATTGALAAGYTLGGTASTATTTIGGITITLVPAGPSAGPAAVPGLYLAAGTLTAPAVDGTLTAAHTDGALGGPTLTGEQHMDFGRAERKPLDWTGGGITGVEDVTGLTLALRMDGQDHPFTIERTYRGAGMWLFDAHTDEAFAGPDADQAGAVPLTAGIHAVLMVATIGGTTLTASDVIDVN